MSQRALNLIAANIRTKNPVLDLGNCGLTELYPELLDELAKTGEWLEELILSSGWWDWETEERKYSQNNGSANQLPLLPPTLPLLLGLKILIVNQLGLTNPSPLTVFRNLRVLDISENQIEECSSLSKLMKINYLNIAKNKIVDCSPLAKIKGLNDLVIWENSITDLSPLAMLPNLGILAIGKNPIADFTALAKFIQLRELYIQDNGINDLRPLASLTKLNILAIPSNQISDCAPLAALTALSKLDISNNQITDCAPLAALQQLSILDISYNQITDCAPLLPLIKKGMPIKLESGGEPGLYIYGNPITNPPLEILEQGNEAVIRYFESGQLRPLNECKLIFVGDGGVGKTSLMRRLVGQDFNPDEQTTHGINKLAWQGIKNKKKATIRVNLWDFGGQHIQHSLHQFFFTERVIYVLVLNPRNDEKAGYWLDQIAALGKESKVLMVYNWKDEKDKEANYLHNFYELRKKYSHLPEPFLLSCKADEGLEEFSNAVKRAVLSHEGLKVQYPAKWFNIKARLERDIPVDTSYIGYETYQQWCSEADYTDPDAQKGLLKILDSIGSIVFFDKPVLNEYPVLNPEWITTGAYAILVAPQTKDKQGHLNWNDLKDIFKEKKSVFSDKEIQIQFTERQIYFILELMLSYNLCQKNPFEHNEYLIPAAFGEQPGKDYEHSKAGARHYRIKFQSSFEMLIIHRFIAKNLLKITDKDYWQSGIYIKHPGSQTFALVETNLYSQEINCWIKGDNVRGFWEVIRSDFNEILEMYHNLPYAEEVWYSKDGKEAFLPYHEMMKAYRKGIFIIDYHPTYDLENINVLEVLELFEQYPSATGSDYSDAMLLGQQTKQRKGSKKPQTLSNKAPEIFFSYAWKDNDNPDREKIVDELYHELLQEGYPVKRDKADVQYGDSIIQFMEELGASANIIVAISDRYLKSEYCMYELHKAYEQSNSDLNNLRHKIYPIRVETVALKDPTVLGTYFEHWEQLETQWAALVAKHSKRITAAQQAQYTRIKSIAGKLGDLLEFLSDLNASTTDVLSQDNFATIKQKIQERMRK